MLNGYQFQTYQCLDVEILWNAGFIDLKSEFSLNLSLLELKTPLFFVSRRALAGQIVAFPGKKLFL